jgi:hypothetical protein
MMDESAVSFHTPESKMQSKQWTKFLATFKKKQPNMAAGEWFFHWDNAPVHTATVVKDWMAAKDFRLIDHPPYLLDLATADFSCS